MTNKKQAMTLLPVFFLGACAPQPTSVEIQGPEQLTVYNLDALTVPSATVSAADGTTLELPVTWSATPAEAARISADGRQIELLAEGQVTVTATSGQLSDSLQVSVIIPDEIVVTGLSSGHTFDVGGGLTLQAEVVNDGQPLPLEITWTTSAPEIISIEGTQLTANAPGSATVTATSGTLTAELALTVAAPAEELVAIDQIIP
jgi:hypothetical protein